MSESITTVENTTQRSRRVDQDPNGRPVHRRLTFSERSFVDPATSETIATSLELAGTLDVDALHQSFGILLREYPVLTAAVENHTDGPVFVADDIARVHGQGFEHRLEPWRGYAQRPPQPLYALDILCALSITSHGERHRVTLWANHCVTDGGGLIAMTVRLYQLFDALVGGRPLGPTLSVPFPRAPHLVMAERGVVPSDVPYEQRLAGTSWSGRMSAPRDHDHVDDVGRVRFTREVTAGLAATAAAQAVSTHALVSGVIGDAEQSELATADGSVALLFPVDFRSRITPPIPLAEVTALVGFSFVPTRVPESGGPVAIARRVHHQLRRDFADGTLLRASVSHMPDPVTRRHGPPVIVSNVGRFPDLSLPDCLVARDFHSQIIRSGAGLAAYRRRWDGPSTPPVPVGSAYLVSVFDDRLSIEMRVLPGTSNAATRSRILRHIDHAVHRLGSGTTSSTTNVSETMPTGSRTNPLRTAR